MKNQYKVDSSKYFNCFFIQSSKRILTYNYNEKKAYLLDSDMKVTHTSAFTSYLHTSAVELPNSVLYYMYDGSKYCLALVSSHDLTLLTKHTLT